MTKLALGLAAALLLGGMATAHAQSGMGEKGPGASQGPGAAQDAAPMPRGGGEQGRRGGGGGDGPGAPGRTMDRAPDKAPAARSSERPTGGSKAERRARSDDGARGSRASDEGRKARGKSAGDGTGADRKARADRKDRKDAARQDRADRKDRAERRKDRDRADRKDRTQEKSARDADAKPDRDRDTSAAEDKPRPADAAKEAAGERKKADEAKKVDLSSDRRDRVQTALRDKRDVRRRTGVDIDIAIGAHLPSDWDYAPVPVEVIEVVPEYRGYLFTYVEDEYVILEPDTYEVVAVLPAGGGTRVAGGGGAAECTSGLTLTEEERDLVVQSIQIADEADVSDVTVGWQVPDDIELRTFPEPVVSRTGKLGACRYFIVDDQIAIVDPDEETVVLLIEHDD